MYARIMLNIVCIFLKKAEYNNIEIRKKWNDKEVRANKNQSQSWED